MCNVAAEYSWTVAIVFLQIDMHSSWAYTHPIIGRRASDEGAGQLLEAELF
jgi:hypothetical protein